MPGQMQKRILALLSEDTYRPVPPGTIAESLRITKRQMPSFREALEELIDEGKIREGSRGRLRMKKSGPEIVGTLKKVSSGAGFVIPSEEYSELRGADLFVSAEDLADAQTGDLVAASLTRRRRSGGQRCGRVTKVLERKTVVFVGTYSERGDRGYVRVDGGVFENSVLVGDPGAKGACPDDQVVIEMLRFPTASRRGEAVLTEVLGKRGDPGVDTQSVIHSLGLPQTFPEDALEEARLQASRFDENELGNRTDFTAETVVTIDPGDARDFDDAISLEQTDDGHWHLAVHIADVAAFIPEGGPLDQEARRRGTSVYLPRHVIPMVPEIISNGLASLQEGQIRLTRSVLMEFDENGKLLGTDVRNSAVRVVRRFAYEEVMPILKAPAEPHERVTPEVLQLLQQMYELAMLLRRNRFRNGALTMGLPEVEIDFNDDGEVIGANERHHDESHEIIEEFMLAANVAVANLLASRNIGFLRRIHGEPDELRLRSFAEFCRGLNYEIPKAPSRANLQQVIRDSREQPEERAVNFALLRSMKQAEYSPEEYGHYALAEEDYCHFTSPIRRYPDLTVHRLVRELADGGFPHSDAGEDLLLLGRHCSETERRAEQAERELIKVRLLRYMEDRIGDELSAVITGVENFGLFCQGTELPAEGLVPVATLDDDFYLYDQTTRCLTGERSRREYRLGDEVQVEVASIDLERRQLNYRMLSEPTHPDHRPFRPRSGSDSDRRGSRPQGSSKVSKKGNRGRRNEAKKNGVAGKKGRKTSRRKGGGRRKR